MALVEEATNLVYATTNLALCIAHIVGSHDKLLVMFFIQALCIKASAK